MGTPVFKNDVLIGKTMTKSYKDDEDEKTDCSIIIQTGYEGVVDNVHILQSIKGYRMIKIKIRSLRVPEIGDKVASRSAQKGTIGMIFNQEDMPFTEEGIVPDIIINPNCVTGDTKITMFNGVSKRIDQLSSEGGELVYSWEKDKNGFELETQLGLDYKGEKEVLKLTLEDGRTIRCTPDHKILTVIEENDEKKYEWIEAKDLKTIGRVENGKWINNKESSSKLIIGPESPLDFPTEEEKKWELITERLEFNMKTKINREKSLAFARILGYVLADGTICKTKRRNEISSSVCLGHQLDVDLMLKDIYLLTQKNPKVIKGITYMISLPAEITYSLSSLEDIMIGRRVEQEQKLPKFLLEDNCPKSIIREFLGGLFGGDGHCPCFKTSTAKNRKDKSGKDRFHLTEIQLTMCVIGKYKESMQTKFENIQKLLSKMGIEDTSLYNLEKTDVFQNIKEERKNLKFYEYRIKIKNSTKFSDLIGFRYCTEKSSRLFAANSYWRYYQNIKRQYNEMIEKTNYYFDNNICYSLQTSLNKWQNTLLEVEPPISEYYSFGNRSMISNRRKKGRVQTLEALDYKYAKDPETFFRDAGCFHWFWEEGVSGHKRRYINNHGDNIIPYLTLNLLDKRVDGVEKVYDISVSKNTSFLANGMLISNCIPSRMTLAQLLECIQGKRCALKGEYADGTPFTDASYSPLEKISEGLASCGFERYGNEMMYNGFTGEQLKAKIFIGPTFYQRLKHLVSDKMHCLTLDHEVLTLDGWKFYDQLSKEDKVAVLKDKKLVYEQPEEILYYPEFNGNLYHIKNENIDLCVTDNHKMFVKFSNEFQLIESKYIKGMNVKYLNLEGEIEVNHNKTDDRFFQYNGPVFCLTVSSGVFYVRRNGKEVWTGNSRSIGSVTMLQRQPAEGRSKEGKTYFALVQVKVVIITIINLC